MLLAGRGPSPDRGRPDRLCCRPRRASVGSERRPAAPGPSRPHQGARRDRQPAARECPSEVEAAARCIGCRACRPAWQGRRARGKREQFWTGRWSRDRSAPGRGHVPRRPRRRRTRSVPLRPCRRRSGQRPRADPRCRDRPERRRRPARRRQETHRVTVGVVVPRRPHAEMHVRRHRGATAGGPRRPELRPLWHVLALAHAEGVEVQVRGVEAAVGGPHRHREPRVAGRACEGHRARGRGPHGLPHRGGDVDAAMLPCGEGIAAVAVRSDDFALHGPGPRLGPECLGRRDRSRERDSGHEERDRREPARGVPGEPRRRDRGAISARIASAGRPRRLRRSPAAANRSPHRGRGYVSAPAVWALAGRPFGVLYTSVAVRRAFVTDRVPTVRSRPTTRRGASSRRASLGSLTALCPRPVEGIGAAAGEFRHHRGRHARAGACLG